MDLTSSRHMSGCRLLILLFKEMRRKLPRKEAGQLFLLEDLASRKHSDLIIQHNRFYRSNKGPTSFSHEQDDFVGIRAVQNIGNN